MRLPIAIALAMPVTLLAAAGADDCPPYGPEPGTCKPGPRCPAPRAPGEVRLVFLGDSGWGPEGGTSEWDTRSQASVANRLDHLLPQRPDRVFFLGDNVYWKGTAVLFPSRFTDVYWPYACRGLTRVVLGNHDVKGCQAVCAPDGTLVSDHRAYEQRQAGGETKACNAFVALAYPEFGFPKLSGEDDTLPHNQRYHETLFPADAPTVKVLGLDSNTLGAEKGLLEEDLPPGHTSCTGVVEDEAQLRWLHERLRPEPGRGVEDRPWTIVAMHHPAFTPRGCSIAWFGCHGGHQDQPGIQYQLRRSAAPSFVPAAQEPGAAAAGERAVPPADVPRDAELAMPDLVFGAHNHFYARSFAVDPWGEPCAEHPALTPPDPVRCRPGRVSRHFVSGGGGAPLYALGPRHDRWAEAIRLHHFVYLRLLPKVAFFWTIDRTGRVRDSGCFQKGDARELRIHGARWFDPVGPENCRLPAEVEPPPR